MQLSGPLRALTLLSQTSPRPDEFHFLGVAPSGEIFRFGDIPAAARQSANTITTASSTDKKSTSIWQEMFGKEAFLDDLVPASTATEAELEAQEREATSALQAQASRSGRPADVFEGPSHTLPPVGLLFDAFMVEMLRTAKSNAGTASNTRAARKAAGRKDEILYEQVDDAVAPQITSGGGRGGNGNGGNGKKVSDSDMVELEVFFKEVLANSKYLFIPQYRILKLTVRT